MGPLELKVGDLVVPTDLAADVRRGGRELSPDHAARLGQLLVHAGCMEPEFFSLETIEREHGLWVSESAPFFLGAKHEAASPGSVDPARVLIIGDGGDESPIALDYRTNPPRVVYLGGIQHVSCWFEVAKSYTELVQLLQGSD